MRWNNQEDRRNLWLYLVASFVVAFAIVTALGWLSFENLSGDVSARQMFHDNIEAIKNLFFRQ